MRFERTTKHELDLGQAASTSLPSYHVPNGLLPLLAQCQAACTPLLALQLEDLFGFTLGLSQHA